MNNHAISRIAPSILVGGVLFVLSNTASNGQGRPPTWLPQPERNSHYVAIVNSKEIPIRSMSWEMERANRHENASAGNLTITKSQDAGATRLLNSAFSGRQNGLTLIARDREGRDTLRYRLENATITSFGTNRGNPPTETFTLHFSRISAERIDGNRNNPNRNNPNRLAWNSMNAGMTPVTGFWDPATERATLNWKAPSGTVVYQYRVYACPGTIWRNSAARLLDTLDKDTFSYTTDYNLRFRGDRVVFRIVTVTNSGERDSLDLIVTRP